MEYRDGGAHFRPWEANVASGDSIDTLKRQLGVVSKLAAAIETSWR